MLTPSLRILVHDTSANTSRRIAKIVVILIWVLATALAAPMAMSWEVVMEDEIDKETGLRFKKPFCAASDFGQHSLHIYRLLLFLFQYLTPLCVITCAYTHMAFKLWVTRAPGNAQELRDAAHMKNKKREKSHSGQTRMYSSIKSSNEYKRCSCRTSYTTNVMSHSRCTAIRYDFGSGHTHTTYIDEGGGSRQLNNNRTRYSNSSLTSKPHLREHRFVVAYNRRGNSDRFHTRAPEAFLHSLDLEDKCTESHSLSNLADHLPILPKLGSFTGEEQPIETKTIIDWKRVSTTFEKVDTPNFSAIPNDIVSNNDIDTAIAALTKYIRSVVKRCQRKVPENSDRRGLPADLRELIRAKKRSTAQCASAYPTPEYRSRTRALQRKVKTRIKDDKNDNCSTLMEEITPNHKTYWAVAKTLKSYGCVAMPTFKKPDNNLAFDYQEKAEYIADSIELQCSLNPFSPLQSRTRKPCQNEVLRSLGRRGPKTKSKELKPRTAPGLDGVSNKRIKCFSAPLLALLVTIFNACIKNHHFPEAWKEAVIIGIPKPGKPHDLPTNYGPFSLLSGLGKLFEKVFKSRFSDHLLGNGLIINEQFGFRPNYSCPNKPFDYSNTSRRVLNTNAEP
ncbi:RNA-directed DNA polymerase from mobile element jockey [Eumeta japonica]|uniref:RNA-directed DNA polymerase from mobile element jockey n=1 Tax=Eumeta variegata TaxID=151549 RepID=A0A4C1ZPG3_EUMVA|nr:RNA-directed DNA polymerase from mobile element jockey [Eumeta japonica]